MITKLNNPKTKAYQEFKKLILGPDCTWNYIPTVENNPPHFYVHGFLKRPSPALLFPVMGDSRQAVDIFQTILAEILVYNKMSANMVYRMAANACHPSDGKQITQNHTDHPFPHSNILIYLTDAGGKIFVDDEEFDPKEDDVIIFDTDIEKEIGLHHHELPKDRRRVVLVATYMSGKFLNPKELDEFNKMTSQYDPFTHRHDLTKGRVLSKRPKVSPVKDD